jgi:hypothetical protein
VAKRLAKKLKTLKLLKGEDCQHCLRLDYRPDGMGGVELYCHMTNDFPPKANTCDEWWREDEHTHQIIMDKIAKATQIPKEYLFREGSINKRKR